MQIVIDISDATYVATCKGNMLPPDVKNAVEAIKNGVPLNKVFNKIRSEIEELDGKYVIGDYATYGEYSPKYVQMMEVLQVIDKCKAESEE